MTRFDTTRLDWPREVHNGHLLADIDHAVDPDYSGENCDVCGLAITSDSKRHGFDA